MKRAFFGLAALLVSLTAIIGVAHTEVGRPLLAYMPWGNAVKGVACPLGYDAPRTTAERASSQRRFAQTHRGTLPAAGRPALGFSLDGATRAEITAWASANHVTCTAPRGGHDLQCHDVAGKILPGAGADVRTLWLDFGADGTLVSVIALRREKTAEQISATFAGVKSELTQVAGNPVNVQGAGTTQELKEGLLRQASAEYRFTNYYAVARATNMPDGFLLTEEYRSLN